MLCYNLQTNRVESNVTNYFISHLVLGLGLSTQNKTSISVSVRGDRYLSGLAIEVIRR